MLVEHPFVLLLGNWQFVGNSQVDRMSERAEFEGYETNDVTMM